MISYLVSDSCLVVARWHDRRFLVNRCICLVPCCPPGGCTQYLLVSFHRLESAAIDAVSLIVLQGAGIIMFDSYNCLYVLYGASAE